MCQTSVHRGPDDRGIYTDSNISLGHRRLSIIDLKTGHQPIHNEDETIEVILNGEIYNFKELREELEDKHEFYTNSDTEVLVHLYEDYGERSVEKLNGMFAFAIWDSVKKKLLLARDPIGKKPLYYHWDGEKLIFASEIKTVLEAEAGIKKEIELDALDEPLGDAAIIMKTGFNVEKLKNKLVLDVGCDAGRFTSALEIITQKCR